jgi:hypothetical protein
MFQLSRWPRHFRRMRYQLTLRSPSRRFRVAINFIFSSDLRFGRKISWLFGKKRSFCWGILETHELLSLPHVGIEGVSLPQILRQIRNSQLLSIGWRKWFELGKGNERAAAHNPLSQFVDIGADLWDNVALDSFISIISTCYSHVLFPTAIPI